MSQSQGTLEALWDKNPVEGITQIDRGDIDISISPWKIPVEADICNNMIVSAVQRMSSNGVYINDPDYIRAELTSLNDYGDIKSVPCMFFQFSKVKFGTMPGATTLDDINDLNATSAVVNSRLQAYQMAFTGMSPIIKFNYRNIIYLVYVYVWNGINNVASYTLKDYEDDEANIKATYPYILGYYIVPYWMTATGTDEVPNRTVIRTGTTISTSIQPRPLKFYTSYAPFTISGEEQDYTISSSLQHQRYLNAYSMSSSGISMAYTVGGFFGASVSSNIAYYVPMANVNSWINPAWGIQSQDLKTFNNAIWDNPTRMAAIATAYGNSWKSSPNDIITSAATGIYTNYNNNYVRCGNPKNWDIHINYTATAPYFNRVFPVWKGTTDDIRKQIAYIGCWFTDNITSAISGVMGEDEHIYLPIISAYDGTTTGQYVSGEECENQINFHWRDDVLDVSPYQPTGNTSNIKPDWNKHTDDESDFGDLTTTLNSGTYGAGCKYYGLNSAQLDSLVSFINSAYTPDSEQIATDFKGSNPFEYINSVIYYPFDLPVFPTTSNISVGPVDTGLSAYQLIPNYGIDNIFDFGSVDIVSYYGDFRDYAPYTKITLIVPFCGTMDLDPALYQGQTISVRLIVDYPTGSATGLIFRNNLLLATINGTAGAQIPLSALAAGDYQNTISNLTTSYLNTSNSTVSAWLSALGGVATTIGGIAVMNPAVIAGGVAALINGALKFDTTNNNLDQIQYSITHTAPHVGTVGAAAPMNSMVLDRVPKIIISRPKMLQSYSDADFAHTTGYAHIANSKLSNFSGFTVCSNADLSGIAATAAEKAILLQTLQTGIYI